MEGIKKDMDVGDLGVNTKAIKKTVDDMFNNFKKGILSK